MIKNIKIIFVLLAVAIKTANLYSQESKSVEHTIVSEVFDTDRKINVFLPERYFRDTTQTLIVAYVLDAQSDDFWNMVKGNIGYLVRQYQVIPMIAVGIVSEDRGEEFDPDSEELKQHLQYEVFPLIEKEYRVNKFRIIIGHSWGGAFVGNILFSEDNDLFKGYIGISPSLGANDEIILNNADSILKQKRTFGKYFYCSSGDIGYRENETYSEILKMDSIFQMFPNETLSWNYEVFNNTDHWSCVVPSINSGLIRLSRNYFADQKQMEDFEKSGKNNLRTQIEEFNKLKSQKFGFSFEPSHEYLRFVADDFREQKKYEAAKELYLLSIERGDNHVVSYFNLAQTCESLGQAELSKANYLKSLSLLEEQKKDLSNSFYNALKTEINNRLKKYE